jgi:hypothetical protein
VAFALWNEGRKEEAIAFLERQIALQKAPDTPAGAISPRGRIRVPVRAGIAAIMLLAIGGALWGGLNPAGIDTLSSDGDAPERPLEATSGPANTAAVTTSDTVSATPTDTASVRPEPRSGQSAAEISEPSAPLPAAAEATFEEPPPEESSEAPISVASRASDGSPETGLAALAPPSAPLREGGELSEPAEAPIDEMSAPIDEMPGEPLRAIVAKASQNARIAPGAPEARLPKPRPQISAGEAMALVREPRTATAPAPRTPVREPREAQAYALPPQIYAPPGTRVPRYGPYGEPQWVIMDPRLAEQRAAAEFYIEQRRAMAEGRPPQQYGPIYYDVRPYPY